MLIEFARAQKPQGQNLTWKKFWIFGEGKKSCVEKKLEIWSKGKRLQNFTFSKAYAK